MDSEAMRLWQAILQNEGIPRRQFLATAAGAIGAVAVSQLWLPGLVRAADTGATLPKPIPGGRTAPPAPEVFFHEYPVARGNEPIVITDFRGYFGVGSMGVAPAMRTDKKTGATASLLWRAEMRFMKGIYVGSDGQEHRGTFGFV